MKSNNKHVILSEPDLGKCPSCSNTMALLRGTNLDKLLRCPICGAMSYGYKWQADKGLTTELSMLKAKGLLRLEETNDSSR